MTKQDVHSCQVPAPQQHCAWGPTTCTAGIQQHSRSTCDALLAHDRCWHSRSNWRSSPRLRGLSTSSAGPWPCPCPPYLQRRGDIKIQCTCKARLIPRPWMFLAVHECHHGELQHTGVHGHKAAAQDSGRRMACNIINDSPGCRAMKVKPSALRPCASCITTASAQPRHRQHWRGMQQSRSTGVRQLIERLVTQSQCVSVGVTGPESNRQQVSIQLLQSTAHSRCLDKHQMLVRVELGWSSGLAIKRFCTHSGSGRSCWPCTQS